MIHFQWTGSDYNPRRGCNDATGGPPDANTFFTAANANQNPRADRSNLVFTDHMALNIPKDYQGYDEQSTTLTFDQKTSTSKNTILANAPCYDPATDSTATRDKCYASIMRLAYLNQQSDVGSLVLRGGRNCLTQDELDAINNEDVADFHPLNCAKMNAKPYPYFDGGIMMMKKSGYFPFYSSRNNNFSNRQQIGVICVGASCKVDENQVLQDQNPQTTGTEVVRSSASRCYDTAGGQAGANSNGVSSCLSSDGTTTTGVLDAESFAIQEGDNDAKGSGNARGCAVLTFSDSNTTVEQQVALAFILLAVGLFTSWLAYYLYNRYQARKDGESKFRYQTAWQKDVPIDGAVSKRAARPTSAKFAMSNPGVKMSRTNSAGASKSLVANKAASPKNSPVNTKRDMM